MNIKFFLNNLLFKSYILITVFVLDNSKITKLPLIINTWKFTHATQAGWLVLANTNGTVLDAVEIGCSVCEKLQCDGSVGYGSHPNEKGNVSLDAMIFDGKTQKVGAVGNLYKIKNAISVARKVLEHTQHTILTGEDATQFALNFDFKIQNLETNNSNEQYKKWLDNNCQPNSWLNVKPDPKKHCGPYKSINQLNKINENKFTRDKSNHDTIGMIAIDVNQQIAVGTSSNGQNHKIPGRVGDSAIPGAGGYADNEIGAAVLTGDGDVMMRFSPAFNAVRYLNELKTPTDAARLALEPIYKKFPNNSAAIVVANKLGDYGAACFGIDNFFYSFRNPFFNQVKIKKISCFAHRNKN